MRIHIQTLLLIFLWCCAINKAGAQSFAEQYANCEQLVVAEHYTEAVPACALALSTGFAAPEPDSNLLVARFYYCIALRGIGENALAADSLESLGAYLKQNEGCSDDMVTVYDQLTAVYAGLNDPRKKIESMETVINCEQSLHGDSSEFMITYYYLCGDDYIITGDYARAIQYLSRAIELYPYFYPEHRSDPFYARMLTEYASPLRNVGKTEQAFAMLDTAWALVSAMPEDEDVTNIKNDIVQLRVWFYDGLDQPEKAVDAVLQQIALSENMELQLRANSLVGAAMYLINFDIKYGTTVARDNSFLQVLENVLEIYDSLPPDPIYLSNAFMAIGNYYQIEQIPDSVIHYYRKSASLIGNAYGRQNVIYLNNLVTQSSFLRKLGNIREAADILDSVYVLSKQFLQSNFIFLSAAEQEKVLSEYIPLMETRNAMYAVYPQLSAQAGEKLFDAALFMKGLLLQNITGLRNRVAASGDSALIELFTEWTSLKKQIAAGALNNAPVAAELTSRAELLEKKILQSKRVDHSMYQPVNTKDIERGLERSSAVIECMHLVSETDDAYYAAVLVQGDKEPQVIRLCAAAALEEVLARKSGESDATFINRLYGTADPYFPEDSIYYRGQQLYNMLWRPLESVLQDVQHIYISPDAQLHTIAWHAIPDSLGVPAIQHRSITYVNSARDILRSEKETIEGEVLLAGGFNYRSTGAAPYWRALPGTLNEIRSISDILQQIGINSASYAFDMGTEENMIAYLSQYALLHIATHGFAFPVFTDSIIPEQGTLYKTAHDPLQRCGLVLSGGDRGFTQYGVSGNEDHILTGAEIANLDLTNVQLVVLSACETSGGDLRGSEGVYGLQRAFRMAGAGDLIISLWQVPDAYTAELMQAFYTALLQGNTASNALRTAQLAMQKKSEAYYWAAFKTVEK